MTQVAQVAGQANGQTAGQPSYADLLAMVKKLQEEKAQPKNGISFSIGEKGGVSASGLGRFPTTLYAEQWLKLIDAIEQQSLRTTLATWLSKGSILLKGGKDESAQSILARSIAMGQAMLAPVAPAPAVAVPAAK